MKIDRTGPSTIGHHDWGNKRYFLDNIHISRLMY